MLKKHILFLFALLCVFAIQAQQVVKDTSAAPAVEIIYNMFDIQKAPSFPGGEKELMKFLNQHIDFPAAAREKNIQGTAVVQFVVRKDGSITDIMVTKPVGGGCSEEAERVIRLMPRWMPGELKGAPVNVRFTLPVRFRLV